MSTKELGSRSGRINQKEVRKRAWQKKRYAKELGKKEVQKRAWHKCCPRKQKRGPHKSLAPNLVPQTRKRYTKELGQKESPQRAWHKFGHTKHKRGTQKSLAPNPVPQTKKRPPNQKELNQICPLLKRASFCLALPSKTKRAFAWRAKQKEPLPACQAKESRFHAKRDFAWHKKRVARARQK